MDADIEAVLAGTSALPVFGGKTPDVFGSSVLAQRLLNLLGWGVLKPVAIQWLCEGAVIDGPAHPDIKYLAQIGTNGEHKQNCRRDVFRVASKGFMLPTPVLFQVPHIKPYATLRNEVHYTAHPIISPGELTNAIFKHYPRAFAAYFEANLEEFWNQVVLQEYLGLAQSCLCQL